MISLSAILTEKVGAAFAGEGLPHDLGRVQVSDRPDLAQFQCNGAMAAAKIAKEAPRKIAERISERLKTDPAFEDVSLAGPGFINLSLRRPYLSEHVNKIAGAERCGVAHQEAKRIVMDFGGPNVAKPMHVGHLRSTIIGDSLQRLARFLGHKVVSDVHLGDWGLQMGQLISEMEISHPDLPYFEPGAKGPFPKEPPVALEELEVIYPAASAACKADEGRRELARKATTELQAGRPGYRALWQHFVDVSLEAVRREFASLGVSFDLWYGESQVSDLVPQVIEKLKTSGLAEMSEGALIVRVAKNDDKRKVPPLILVNSEGGIGYHATDVATIVDRIETINPDLVLYIVDQRQELHFEQVFRSVALAKMDGKASFEHIGFGTMNGTDGKPFKTREGGVMKLFDLIGMAKDKALERLSEAGLADKYSSDEKDDVARKVALAAIKFADLSNYRRSDYVFDLDRFVTFEGKTGPYLQYAAVRIKSILRRAEEAGITFDQVAIDVQSVSEKDLVLAIDRLTDAIDTAFERRAPNVLAEYVYELAQAFSTYYGAHHILSEEDAKLRASRLHLAALTLRVFEQVLDLLGIEVPDRM